MRLSLQPPYNTKRPQEEYHCHLISLRASLRASSPFGGYREKYTRERHARGDRPLAASQLARAFSRGLLRSPK